MCRRANKEGERFRDVACSQSGVWVALIVLGPEGVKGPDHVFSRHVGVRGWRLEVYRDSQWKGRRHGKDKGEIGGEKQRISVSKGTLV